jgi:hypothetical protein
MRPSPKRVKEYVAACLKIGPKLFPKPLPTVQDEADQKSDFMYGILLGLRAMRRKKKWEVGDPIKFLLRNGIWTVRRKRYRLIARRLQILCKCGKRLKISQEPCHGTMGDRIVQAKIVPMDSSLLESIEEIKLGRGMTPALVDI